MERRLWGWAGRGLSGALSREGGRAGGVVGVGRVGIQTQEHHEAPALPHDDQRLKGYVGFERQPF